MRKLSARAWEILLMIDEYTERDDAGELSNFWTPDMNRPGGGRGCGDWCIRLGRFINVNGSGDCRIITSLVKRGLLCEQDICKYASNITEDGRLLIEQNLAAGTIPLVIP